jgi:hypothetical protein
MDTAPLPCADRAGAELGALLEIEDGLVVHGVLAARPAR